MILLLREIPRWLRQSLIKRPNTRCLSSQSSNRFDDRAKAQAASKINGVVGMPGTTIPINPTATQRKPIERYTYRITQKMTLCYLASTIADSMISLGFNLWFCCWQIFFFSLSRCLSNFLVNVHHRIIVAFDNVECHWSANSLSASASSSVA